MFEEVVCEELCIMRKGLCVDEVVCKEGVMYMTEVMCVRKELGV